MNYLCFIIRLLEYVIIGVHLDLSRSRSIGIHINLILIVYVLTQIFIGWDLLVSWHDGSLVGHVGESYVLAYIADCFSNVIGLKVFLETFQGLPEMRIEIVGISNVSGNLIPLITKIWLLWHDKLDPFVMFPVFRHHITDVLLFDHNTS